MLEIDRIKRYSELELPENMDFYSVTGLRKESQEKLNQYKPSTISQAQKIAGINPADIAVLMTAIRKQDSK